jgi:thiamine-phosphate pyrophosphorylase
MSSSPAPRGRIEAPRLYLFTPRIGGDAGEFARALPEALKAGDVAAVLLRLEEADERTLVNRVKAIAPVVQAADVALLLEGRPELVGRAGADGAHLTGIEALSAALPSLKPERIAGAGGLRSRHDAMLAAEAGADYVMFGEPAPAPARRAGGPDEGDRQPPFALVLERVAWWAQLFESPCVGYAASLDEVLALARAQADFVALGEWIWTHAQSPAAAISEAAAHLSSAPA